MPRSTLLSCAVLLMTVPHATAQGRLIVDDRLTDGTTIGIRDNGQGQFVEGGWKRWLLLSALSVIAGVLFFAVPNTV